MKCVHESFPMFAPESKAEGDLIQKAYEYQVARTAMYRAVNKMDRAAVAFNDAAQDYRNEMQSKREVKIK